jgi:putative redox protein
MASVRLELEGSGATLAGKLELPDGPLRGYAVLAHCFTCGKDFKATRQLARALAGQGWATLRFDMTGIGESGGDFAATGLATQIADVVAAATGLAERYAPPALLVGHSFGGVAVLAAAARLPEVRAVAVIATPAEPAHVLHQLGEHLTRVEAEGEAVVPLGGRPLPVRRAFVDEARAADLAPALGALGRALLVLHSPTDETVGVENARALYDAARHPKSFVSLDDADHLLTRRVDADHAAGVIAAWARRYVPEAPVRAADAAALDPGAVQVESTAAGRFQQAVRAGRHRLVADEPEAVGGTDTGPGPYDLLLAALGACTSMTLRLYADRKSWPLEAVAVRLTHRREHVTDCEGCEAQPMRVDVIDLAVTLSGPLDAAQRARLLEMAERCPVHRTLAGEVRMVTREVAGE